MLQAFVSPEICSPEFSLIVQITLSFRFASQVPANFFCAVTSRTSAMATHTTRTARGFDLSKSVTVGLFSSQSG